MQIIAVPKYQGSNACSQLQANDNQQPFYLRTAGQWLPCARGLHLVAERTVTTTCAAFSPRQRQVSSNARARPVTVGQEEIVS